MEEPPLPKQALARIKAAKLEAGADLLNGLAAFWRGIGMSTKALAEMLNQASFEIRPVAPFLKTLLRSISVIVSTRVLSQNDGA